MNEQNYIQQCIVNLVSTGGVWKQDLLLLGAYAYEISISKAYSQNNEEINKSISIIIQNKAKHVSQGSHLMPGMSLDLRKLELSIVWIHAFYLLTSRRPKYLKH